MYVRYPVMFYNDKKKCVKRLIYKNFVRAIEKNEYVSMKCKNPLCVNINHMITKKCKIKIKIPEEKPLDPEKFRVYFD